MTGGPTQKANRAKRRALREQAADVGAHIDRDAIYARDGGYCYLCKLHVARELATFDHVIALAEGGTDDEDNVRLAHRGCNSKKGDDPLVGPKPKRPGVRRARRLAAVARRIACIAILLLCIPPARASGRRCVALGPLPDPVCTPGLVATVDLTVICAHRTRERRYVPESAKRAVREAYGVPEGADVEVDHLIPLELGGSNDERNLWPELAGPPPGFHEKDRVENALHRAVCAGEMPLADAQRRVATDWTAVWRKIEDGGAP
jgi:5-methylcytosine-specific restriction endonuclease McrA